jgi:hypothetical protein
MSTKPSQPITPQQKKRIPLWLPLIIVAGVALIVVTVFSATRNAAPAAATEVVGAPALKVDKEKVDLGTIALGTTIEVKFEVTNVGDQPLVFTKAPYLEVVKGCCPSQPKVGQRTLNPGEHTTVVFPMMMHEGMGGEHDFRLHLPTNATSQSDKTVQILSNWQ